MSDVFWTVFTLVLCGVSSSIAYFRGYVLGNRHGAAGEREEHQRLSPQPRGLMYDAEAYEAFRNKPNLK